ncbi:phosphoserine aminotransferase [Phascolomyces articulosus]|uniref:Phosphoserine aminotransferase n=1 Tax=Phascolomyces articulosus TaxID=60185 RepID=A0AAD5P907_9FUNG|nr:phosphoserine aminotransferase [Phascolomyces articulosus]
MEPVYNFGAGPAKIPESVLKRAQVELLNYGNTGMSVMELSHRSKTFGEILARTKSNLRNLLDIPDNYEILFMQGGATTQFSAIFYNLVAAKQAAIGEDKDIAVDYFVTGSWSNKACQEAERLSQDMPHVRVNRVADAKKLTGKYGQVPAQDTWQLSDPEQTAYVYYCDNETVHGVEFANVPEVDPRVPLVADMSSNFLSRPVDVKKFGVIYGGAQKNLGPAGVTLVIVRKDLVVDLKKGPLRPLMLDYQTMLDNDSMYNTPPTFAIYMVGLTLEWLLEHGGLTGIQVVNARKSGKLYDAIDRLSLFKSPVQPDSRSKMNVVFNLTTPELEKEFLKGGEERNMVQLKGHRSVGGVRASIYNAMPEEHIDKLIEYMEEFQNQHAA